MICALSEAGQGAVRACTWPRGVYVGARKRLEGGGCVKANMGRDVADKESSEDLRCRCLRRRHRKSNRKDGDDDGVRLPVDVLLALASMPDVAIWAIGSRAGGDSLGGVGVEVAFATTVRAPAVWGVRSGVSAA